MRARIIGTGSCLPETVVTNDDLAKIMDTSDEWISSRTGIRERHLVKDETTAGMSAKAAKRAMEDAGVSAAEIDLIIVGTLSADNVTPSCACEVQAQIGAVNAVAFDINAACAGFMFALNVANAYLQMGTYKTALILGAETLSKIMDWNDRSTCVLFGDGAGAAVVRAEEGTAGLLAFDQGSDGVKGGVLACRGRSNNNPLVETSKELSYVQMDGQEVFKFAVRRVSESIDQLLERNGLTAGDIGCYVLHQANARIIASVIKHLKADADKFPMNVERCGNTSGASVPLLLDELSRSGRLREGDRVIMSGFGGGLTWGSIYMIW